MKRVSLENDDLEGANNVYLLDTDERTVLVDTGEHARDATLRSALEEAGVTYADIDDVLLTHWHPDHSGLAGTIQDESGATVHVHEADAALVERDPDTWAEFGEMMQSRLETWGVPEGKREELFARREQAAHTETATSVSVATFTDGKSFAVGDHDLSVVHTPGHTAGSVCFAFDTGTNNDLITGDTILPSYTPNVGGSDIRLGQPLDEYLTSLYSLAEADYDRAWPGHREPIADTTGRAHEIIAHHERRAGRILAILDRTGPATVWSVCSELFGELENFHVLIGAGEVFAHLSHLEEQGDVAYEADEYVLADDARSAIDADVDTWSLAVSDSPT